MSALLITGTGTGVGKTIATAALARITIQPWATIRGPLREERRISRAHSSLLK